MNKRKERNIIRGISLCLILFFLFFFENILNKRNLSSLFVYYINSPFQILYYIPIIIIIYYFLEEIQKLFQINQINYIIDEENKNMIYIKEYNIWMSVFITKISNSINFSEFKQFNHLERFFGGLTGLKELLQAIFLVDAKKERTAFREAKAKKIPVIALTDTNTNPTGIDYLIPANDDAVKSVKLITSVIAEAAIEGKK